MKVGGKMDLKKEKASRSSLMMSNMLDLGFKERSMGMEAYTFQRSRTLLAILPKESKAAMEKKFLEMEMCM
jgi:hypothetical protein